MKKFIYTILIAISIGFLFSGCVNRSQTHMHSDGAHEHEHDHDHSHDHIQQEEFQVSDSSIISADTTK